MKLVTISLVLGLMAGLLCGCSGDKGDSTSTPAATAGAAPASAPAGPKGTAAPIGGPGPGAAGPDRAGSK